MNGEVNIRRIFLAVCRPRRLARQVTQEWHGPKAQSGCGCGGGGGTFRPAAVLCHFWAVQESEVSPVKKKP